MVEVKAKLWNKTPLADQTPYYALCPTETLQNYLIARKRDLKIKKGSTEISLLLALLTLRGGQGCGIALGRGSTSLTREIRFSCFLLTKTTLKVLTNEKRGGLNLVSFDWSRFKLFTLKFSKESVQTPSCERPKTAQRSLFLSFEINNYYPITV